MNSLSAQDVEIWTAYIKNICGNDHDASKTYLLESRLTPLYKETNSSSWIQLYSTVRNDLSGNLKRKVINAITTNETSFFRDSSPFELLQYKIIPDLIDIRRKKSSQNTIPIRIWSAACSTGQEVYSIAIILKEMLGDMRGFDIRILGTDISDKVIAQASYAKYSKLELERGLSDGKVEKFFIRDGEMWRVKDEIRALAMFKTLNLLDSFLFPQKFDIILCRNVAIYFSIDDKKRLFSHIANVLAPDGYLIIGSTETLSGLNDKLEAKRYLRSVFYQLSIV